MIGRLVGAVCGRVLLWLCSHGLHAWEVAPLGPSIGALAKGFDLRLETCSRCGVVRALDPLGRRRTLFKD